MLHILRYSPWKCNLNEMLRMMKKNDNLLLIQDGVVGAIRKNRFIKILIRFPITIFALKEDIDARGISHKISTKVEVINYGYFIELTVKNINQISW